MQRNPHSANSPSKITRRSDYTLRIFLESRANYKNLTDFAPASRTHRNFTDRKPRHPHRLFKNPRHPHTSIRTRICLYRNGLSR
jgi:hypothetical protein